MRRLKSRYNIAQLFVALVIVFFFFGCLGALINSKSIDEKKIILLPLAMAFLLYALYVFFKRAPLISFDENFILIRYPFSKIQYSWSQVNGVDLHTKENYSFLFITQSMEAMKVSFEDGAEVLVWHDMYRNMTEMRRMVAEQTGNKFQYKAIDIKPPKANFMQQTYAGNALLTFNSLLVFGIVAFLFFLDGKNKNSGLIAGLIMAVVMVIAFGTQMYFFQIDTDKLIIRNHYFFWIKKEIYLGEIEEVAVESPHKRSDSLRIITKDFRSKLYGAGSLRSRHWKDLGKDLRSFGIIVRWDTVV